MVVDTLLNNRFAINDTDIKPIGEGGMAVIYAGIDTETDRPIAAKTLLPEFQGDSHRRSRFRNEAAILKAVQHPYVVELVDIVDGRRGSWILMEQLDGENLRDKLAREGPFDFRTVNLWLAQVCAALEQMHQQGYVHLDLTPQNLILTSGGDIKLIDFGIAQKAYSAPRKEGGKLLGTAAYISPEHAVGGVVTPASDIYSLGCVVFELLTGHQVFSEHGRISNDATVAMRQSNVPDLPTSVAPELNLPVWIDTVVANALMPNAHERYPSATAFAESFNAHANPPKIRLNWRNRNKPEHSHADKPDAITSVPPQRTESAPVAIEPAVREQTRAGRWVRKELRNARRAVIVFALLLSVVFAAPLLGGSVTMDWLLGVVPGSNTVVVNGDWNMRSGPTQESEILTLLRDGQSVRVTGKPILVGEDFWWPIDTDVNETRISGFAFDDGLKRTWLMNRAAGVELGLEPWTNRWERVTGLLPG